MKNSKVIVIALAIVLSLATAVVAFSQLTVRVVNAQTEKSCCQDASCCSGGACKMNGACCGSNHKSNAANAQKTENVKYAGVQITDETASCQPETNVKTAADKSDCCAGGGSSCCHSGAACCSSKKQTASL